MFAKQKDTSYFGNEKNIHTLPNSSSELLLNVYSAVWCQFNSFSTTDEILRNLWDSASLPVTELSGFPCFHC